MTSNPSAPGDKPENRPFLERVGEINSEEDYNHASSQLADELMRENTAEELALALANHLIYVDALQAIIREKERLIQAQEAVTTRREELIINLLAQAATETASKTATLAVIAVRRNLPRIMASNAAKSKHAASAKAQEKEIMKACWKEWQADPKRYRSKAAFARDMLDKFPGWLNTKVIEGFCRDWEGGKEEK